VRDQAEHHQRDTLRAMFERTAEEVDSPKTPIANPPQRKD
jgi:hypothetical protein